MSISDSKAANVLGGKTARPCDSCLLKRARWFCASDDAFLCQACDSSVHSANELASRHERVRLEISSFKVSQVNSPTPSWHQGFTRKPRTPRQTKLKRVEQPACSHFLPLVPEINGEDPLLDENEDLLLYRVPVFDPFADEFCTDIVKGGGADFDLNLGELLSSCDPELTEFAANVECLLEAPTGEDYDYLSKARVDRQEEGIKEFSSENRVKTEEDDDEVQAVVACHFDPALDMELNWDFNYSASILTGEDTKRVAEMDTNANIESGSDSQIKGAMLLRLNYEAVMDAWASQGSPWANGVRPDFDLDEFMDACSGGGSLPCGGIGRANDAGREAKVTRYREKRRTRLFSKKIRYEVRKLNAEKRPRMKGRFVKRANFSGPSLPYLMNN